MRNLESFQSSLSCTQSVILSKAFRSFFLIFGVQQFWCDVSRCGFLCVYPVWVGWSWVYKCMSFYQIWQIFSYYFFKKKFFFFLLWSLFPILLGPQSYILGLLLLSSQSWGLFPSSFFSECSLEWVISPFCVSYHVHQFLCHFHSVVELIREFLNVTCYIFLF